MALILALLRKMRPKCSLSGNILVLHRQVYARTVYQVDDGQLVFPWLFAACAGSFCRSAETRLLLSRSYRWPRSRTGGRLRSPGRPLCRPCGQPPCSWYMSKAVKAPSSRKRLSLSISAFILSLAVSLPRWRTFSRLFSLLPVQWLQALFSTVLTSLRILSSFLLNSRLLLLHKVMII